MTATITPIRGSETQPPGDGPKPPRGRKRARKVIADYLKLRESDDGEGFTTLDLVEGLAGVCRALDDAAVTDGCRNTNLVCNLAQAAKVLSDMAANRVVLGEIRP